MARRADHGFTLVEVLTAMFIAALAAAIVVAAMPAPRPDEASAAERLASDLARAQRAGVVQGAAVGLMVSQEGYHFAVWRDGAWRALDRASGLGPREWPEDALVAASSDRATGLVPEGFPAVVFDETGGADPFRIEISGPRARTAVRGDAAGRLTVEADDA